jgi:hypothetical protein
MAFFDSEKSVFRLDDTGGNLRDISTYLQEMSGLPGSRKLNEVTALGDGGTKWHPSLEDVQISLSGTYDDTATTGPDAILGPLRTHTAELDFDYGPKGSAGSATKYSGKFFCTDYQVQSRVGELVMWTATLQVNGKVARGTY